MDKRFLLFMLLATALFFVNTIVIGWFKGKPAQNQQVEADDDNKKNIGGKTKEVKKIANEKTKTAKDGKTNKSEKIAPQPKFVANDAKLPSKKSSLWPRTWVALGDASADPENKYRMSVVICSSGASVVRVALNRPQFLELIPRYENQGYPGYWVVVKAEGLGAKIVLVDRGSPANEAGLIAGLSDRKKGQDKLTVTETVTSVKTNGDGETIIRIRNRFDLLNAVSSLQVGDAIALYGTRRTVTRDFQGEPLSDNSEPFEVMMILGHHPLEVIKTETADFDDPSGSFLLTLAEFGEARAAGDKESDSESDGADLFKRTISKDSGITWQPGGAIIASVAKGSPAEQAGLRAGDKVTKLDNTEITSGQDFSKELGQPTIPTGAYLKITYDRKGESDKTTRLALPSELPGVDLYTSEWRIEEQDESHVTFVRELPKLKLKFVKRYTLANDDTEDGGPAYHLTLDVEIVNLDAKARTIKYQLDGPQGLPTEGWWYGNKISRESGRGGTRDLVWRMTNGTTSMMNCSSIAAGTGLETIHPQLTDPSHPVDLRFMAMDTRYFAAVIQLLKTEDQTGQQWIHTAQPLIVGAIPDHAKRLVLANVSFRLISMPFTLEPQGAENDRLAHSFQLFLGPKERDLLSNEAYQLDDLIYYGWPIFSVVARMMTGILHFFYGLIPNYAVAIILLTVLVRGAMFPLSRKQALGAQKMQMLQPELKRITEQHKNNYEQRVKAQRELFKKHNYKPLGGCLLLFFQLPIFIGLYKGLSVDTELRQAPLISGMSWCSDLSAPDRLFRWDGFMPDFLAAKTGFLGPYFNLLPLITIVLFMVHQKLFMPPPTDDQQVMQQKMMKYMMVFMGFMFFCVPSGLCLYFIASSLWGIAERKLLPKTAKQEDGKVAKRRESRSTNSTDDRKAQRPAGRNKDSGKKRRKNRRRDK